MLKLDTRDQYQSLLDAVTLNSAEDSQPALIYLETGQSARIISRADFRMSISRYASAMQYMGICPRDLVVIAHTQNLESIFAFWGALFIGAIPSMFPTLTEKLSPDIYMRSMGELIRLSGVAAVLTTDEFAPTLQAQAACPVYGTQELLSAQNTSVSPIHNVNPDEIAFLQHSSGTTGLQKGVSLSHRAVLNQLASYSDALQLTPNDVIVSWLPLYHDMGLIAGFLLPLMQGIPLVLMSPFDWVQHPALLFRAIHDFHGTLCWLPNFAYNHCARRIRQRDVEGLSVRSMRAFIKCSEPVYHQSHVLFAERFAAQGVTSEMLKVSYAMAENTFAVTQTPMNQAAQLEVVDKHELEVNRRAVQVSEAHPNAVTKVSCGSPIAGTAVRVLDGKGNVLPERHVGELVIHSDCMLTGYYKRPDLQPFKDGWYVTGDMGYAVDGEVYVIGRFKDLIINAGKNIYPQDIESIVNEVEGVRAGRAVAFGVPDEREGTELIAVIAEVETIDEDSRKQISKAIRQAVAQGSSVTLSYVHLVDAKWLIKTSSGKIARAANRDKWLAEREAQAE
jgi:acyl-CoA synthetase (AMP-forming)/AMP-acid ligase II